MEDKAGKSKHPFFGKNAPLQLNCLAAGCKKQCASEQVAKHSPVTARCSSHDSAADDHCACGRNLHFCRNCLKKLHWLLSNGSNKMHPSGSMLREPHAIFIQKKQNSKVFSDRFHETWLFSSSLPLGKAL